MAEGKRADWLRSRGWSYPRGGSQTPVSVTPHNATPYNRGVRQVICDQCGGEFFAKRADARLCSNACRQTRHRANKFITREKRSRAQGSALQCEICLLRIPAVDVLFAMQTDDSGGWWTAVAHAEPCGAYLLLDYRAEYRPQLCRGCERTMWVRNKSRRRHCSDYCRQQDYHGQPQFSAAPLQ